MPTIHRTIHRDKKAITRALNYAHNRVLEYDAQILDIVGKQDPTNDANKTGENLLQLRRILVEYIKTGMLDRNNCELEIIGIASMIYLKRQSYEEQSKIINGM